MLYVKYKAPASGEQHATNGLHLHNRQRTVENIIGRPVEEITSIQADGDELEEIIEQFANLVYPKRGRVVTWRGEAAQFIYEHLKL